MKQNGVALLVVLSMSTTASAGPILLATISNTWRGTDAAIIQEYSAGDRLLYVVIGQAGWGDLFEDTRVALQLDGPPVTINESVTFVDDADFSIIAQLLTDGISLGNPDGGGFQEISVLGRIGGEEMLDVHVPKNSTIRPSWVSDRAHRPPCYVRHDNREQRARGD